jgi:transposase-like protein
MRPSFGARPSTWRSLLPDDTRDILEIWIEQTEGAKFRMKVFTDLKTRGCHDTLIAVTDGLKNMRGKSIRRAVTSRPTKRRRS